MMPKCKAITPDYQRLFDSYVHAAKTAYDEYKKAYIEMISNTWIFSDGTFGYSKSLVTKLTEKEEQFKEAYESMVSFKNELNSQP